MGRSAWCSSMPTATPATTISARVFHHGASFRRAVEEGLIDPKRTIQIGIRGSLNVADMWQFSYDSGMRVAEEARKVVGDDSAYLSFDIDSLDPVYAPGTGTPEPGGLTTLEAQRLIRDLGGLNFVGADLVEVSPPFDTGGITSMTAVAILFELLCMLAQARVRRDPIRPAQDGERAEPEFTG
jgi:guanidinopropionase